jgi:curved DNA-binding protein CbpA
VLTELQTHQDRLGLPPADASADDPRQRIDRALTYYTNHRSRMNYPEYRRQGLPITSSLMESAIKQLNQRVKGTEKYWNQTTAEAILQLRADSLCDSAPLPAFWTRWQQKITGMNRYRVGA